MNHDLWYFSFKNMIGLFQGFIVSSFLPTHSCLVNASSVVFAFIVAARLRFATATPLPPTSEDGVKPEKLVTVYGVTMQMTVQWSRMGGITGVWWLCFSLRTELCFPPSDNFRSLVVNSKPFVKGNKMILEFNIVDLSNAKSIVGYAWKNVSCF